MKDEEIISEIEKCKNDIVYFAENYYTSANIDGIWKMPLFKAQKRVLRGMAKRQDIITLGARQVGLTTLNGICALWEALFTTDSYVGIISHKRACAENIMDRITMAYDKLPEWMRLGVYTCNTSKISFKNGSMITIMTAPASACCGMTLSTLIIDNAAFIPDRQMDELWNSIVPVMSSSRRSRLILTSTPNGATGKFAEMCTISQRSCNNWHFDVIKYNDIPGRGRTWKKNMIECIGVEAFKKEFQCEFI